MRPFLPSVALVTAVFLLGCQDSGPVGPNTEIGAPNFFNQKNPKPHGDGKGGGRIDAVEVSPATAAVEVGATVQLTATAKDRKGRVVPDVTFSWTSSDPSVATVSATDGLVTGVSEGGPITITGSTNGKKPKTGSAELNVVVPPGEVISWAAPVSGNWSVAGRWDLGRRPAPNDTVVIDLPGTYLVTIDIPTVFSLMLFGGAAGSGGRQVINVLERVTVRDSLHATRITGFSLDGPNAVLDGAGSAVFESDFIFSAGRIAIDVTVGLDGGTLQLDGTGDKVISDGAVLTYIQVARFRDASTVILQDGSIIQWEFSPFTYFDGLTGAFEVLGQMVLKGSGQINLSDAKIGFLATAGLLQGRIHAQESTSINLSNADFATRVPGTEPPGTVIDLILLSDGSVLTGPVVDLSVEYDPAVNPVSGVGLRATKQ